MKTTYPPAVIEVVDKVFATGVFDEFLNEEKIEIQFLKEPLYENLLSKFIAGDDLTLTIEEISLAMNTSAVLNALNSLKQKGLIGCYEDEEGSEAWFLTKKGEEYNKNKDKNE